jgi:Beta propeller domain
MKTFMMAAIATALVSFGLIKTTGGFGHSFPPGDATDRTLTQNNQVPNRTMHAFRSEQELASYFRELAEKQKRERQWMSVYSPLSPPPAPIMKMSAALARDSRSESEDSVTNVQEAGVDEGGIVKVHGNHLVVLRRGRLFTVAIGDGALDPISSVDAFAPDIDPRSTWYDEMLVSDDTIAVIGYSYERGGTEVGLFHIDPSGKLTYRSTYHLRSNDYYSSRNYASRLIGTKLIFYSPLYFYPGAEDPFQILPAVRKWHKGATNGEFRRIVSASNVYRPEHEFNSMHGSALHTVTVCDLARGDFDCHATSVAGPPGRVFYISSESVYVWVNDWMGHGKQMRAQSMIYRLPLDGSAPTALGVSGSPVDQFSFLESEDGHLNVLLRSDTAGDGMWGAEVAAGDMSLMRIPLASFSDGSETVPRSSYRRLPKAQGYTFQNRFVGDYLLYGTGNGWGYPQTAKHASLYALRWAGGAVRELSLTHGVDRIEEMGSDAVVVGTDGEDLHFSAVRLGDMPEVVDEYIRKGASQGELRSQGFFYKPDTRDSWTLGLPISTPARPGYRHLFDNSAAVLFLRNDSLHFQEVGELAAQPERATDDRCRASCMDWYGNARPLFVRGRVIALLGYELVEGTLDDGHMRESRRVSYAPGHLTASRAEQGEPLSKK